jgi:hypothetical protein
MIRFFRTVIENIRYLFKGLNSSDGLESTMSLLIICLIIPLFMFFIAIVYKFIEFIVK